MIQLYQVIVIISLFLHAFTVRPVNKLLKVIQALILLKQV